MAQRADASYSLTLSLVPGNSSHFVGYKIFLRTANTKYDYTQPAWKGKGTTCIINGLQENTGYYFTARSYDDLGHQSKNSNEIYYRLAATVPSDTTPEPDPETDPNPDPLNPDNAGDQNPPAEAPDDEAGQESTPPDETELDSAEENQNTPTELNPRLQIQADQLPANAANYGKTQWMIFRKDDDFCVFDTTTDRFLATLDIPCLVLEENTAYYWKARFYSIENEASDWTQPIEWVTGMWQADSNGDGIPDLQEVNSFLDLNRNGITDQEEDDIHCVNTVVGGAQVSIGIGADPNAVALPSLESVDPLTITDQRNLPYDAPMGLINFKLLVNSPGDTATLTLYLSAPVSAGAGWYLADALSGWRSYAEYVKFAADRQSVRLKVKDGEIGDCDGVQNGIIVCQSGFGAASTAHSASQAVEPSHSADASQNACFIGSVSRSPLNSVWQRLLSLF